MSSLSSLLVFSPLLLFLSCKLSFFSFSLSLLSFCLPLFLPSSLSFFLPVSFLPTSYFSISHPTLPPSFLLFLLFLFPFLPFLSFSWHFLLPSTSLLPPLHQEGARGPSPSSGSAWKSHLFFHTIPTCLPSSVQSKAMHGRKLKLGCNSYGVIIGVSIVITFYYVIV